MLTIKKLFRGSTLNPAYRYANVKLVKLISGGYSSQYVVSTEIYNIDTDEMATGPNLNKPTYAHCGVESKLRDRIYIIGGEAAWTTTQVFEKVQRTFSTLPNKMSTPRIDPECTILEEEGLLIAAGRLNPLWKEINSVEMLNLESEVWSDVEAIPTVGGQEWAARGLLFSWDETNTYQYLAGSNQWQEIEDVPFPLMSVNETFVQVDAGMGNLCTFN